MWQGGQNQADTRVKKRWDQQIKASTVALLEHDRRVTTLSHFGESNGLVHVITWKDIRCSWPWKWHASRGGLINLRRACAARVTVLGLCVCVCLLLNISFYMWLFVPQTIVTFPVAQTSQPADEVCREMWVWSRISTMGAGLPSTRARNASARKIIKF